MPNALIVVNLVIYKEIVGLEDSEFIIAGALTPENIVFVVENKQVLVAMSHKSFQGIVATVEKVNINPVTKPLINNGDIHIKMCKCNSGTKVVDVTSCFRVRFETGFTVKNLGLVLVQSP